MPVKSIDVANSFGKIYQEKQINLEKICLGVWKNESFFHTSFFIFQDTSLLIAYIIWPNISNFCNISSNNIWQEDEKLDFFHYGTIPVHFVGLPEFPDHFLRMLLQRQHEHSE